MELQWPLMIFTLLICLGAGTLGVAGLLAGLKKSPEVQMTSVVVALVAVVAGGIASFLHLQHWDRIFNGFGHITSGITQELIAIAVFMVLAIVYLIFVKRGEVPNWLGWVALAVSVIVVVVMSNSYNMPSRPVWASPILWLYYLANAVLFGGLVVTIIAALKKVDTKMAIQASLGGGVLAAVSAIAYAVYIPSQASTFTSVGNYFDPTHPTKAMADPGATLSTFLTGDQAVLFWLGVVVIGILVPLVLAYLSMKKQGSTVLGFASVALIAAIVGAVSFRIIFYVLGFSVFVFY